MQEYEKTDSERFLTLGQEFCLDAMEHLNTHRKKFFERLENGDFQAVKLVLDLVAKYDLESDKTRPPVNIEVDFKNGDYNEAFAALSQKLAETEQNPVNILPKITDIKLTSNTDNWNQAVHPHD